MIACATPFTQRGFHIALLELTGWMEELFLVLQDWDCFLLEGLVSLECRLLPLSRAMLLLCLYDAARLRLRLPRLLLPLCIEEPAVSGCCCRF